MQPRVYIYLCRRSQEPSIQDTVAEFIIEQFNPQLFPSGHPLNDSTARGNWAANFKQKNIWKAPGQVSIPDDAINVNICLHNENYRPSRSYNIPKRRYGPVRKYGRFRDFITSLKFEGFLKTKNCRPFFMDRQGLEYLIKTPAISQNMSALQVHLQRSKILE